MKTYLLTSEDYTFEYYRDGGFSGKLYLASPKKGQGAKLIVKHENPCSGCNEFMYSRLAEILHIPAPKAYIFRVCEKDKPLFASPYVVGMEYIEGLRSFSMDELRGDYFTRFDYAGHYALAVMFDQSDAVQLSMTPSGSIVGFDFTETFFLTDLSFNVFHYSPERGLMMLTNALKSFQQSSFGIKANAGLKVVMEHLGASDREAVMPSYHEPMKRICQLKAKHIEPLLDALMEVYPVEVAAYFEEYIEILKKKIQAYIPVAEQWRTVEEVNASLSAEYPEKCAAFMARIKAEYGSKGVREAKKLLSDTLEQYRVPSIPLADFEKVMYAMMDAFEVSKAEAKRKYTPKRYRAAAQEVSLGLSIVATGKERGQ